MAPVRFERLKRPHEHRAAARFRSGGHAAHAEGALPAYKRSAVVFKFAEYRADRRSCDGTARVRPYDICSCVFNAVVWYLDLFAGRNDHAAVQRAGAGGHKEINRTNLTCSDIAAGMKKPIVQKQIELLRMRNQFPVFSANAKIVAEVNGTKMDIRWQSGSEEAVLQIDFGDYSFSVSVRDTSSDTEYFKYDS